MQREMQPLGDVLVSYSAREMPLPVIERIHRETVEGMNTGEVSLKSGFAIVDLLLNISISKLNAPS